MTDARQYQSMHASPKSMSMTPKFQSNSKRQAGSSAQAVHAVHDMQCMHANAMHTWTGTA